MDLSGELGRLVMARWDRKFSKVSIENEIKLDLNLRYVDDDDLVQPAIPPGWRWIGGKMVYDKDYEQQDKELGLTPDRRTANVMVDLANSIHKDIQMVGDTPSDHSAVMGRSQCWTWPSSWGCGGGDSVCWEAADCQV